MLVLAWFTLQLWRWGNIFLRKIGRLSTEYSVLYPFVERWLLRERRLQEITTSVLSIIFICDIYIYKLNLRSRLVEEVSAVCVICWTTYSLRTEEPYKDKQKQTNSPALLELGKRLAPNLIDVWCKSASVNEKIHHNFYSWLWKQHKE
jgi:hypothetical protein